MRTEFIYSFMALGAIPVVANAADVQTISSDVLASTGGNEVKYSVGKLVPGSYTFTAQVLSKVYGVQVNIGGKTQIIAEGKATAQGVNIEFTLTQETDVELTLVSSDPGEAGAGFSVADAKVILNFDLAKAKEDWATAIGLLKTNNVLAYDYDDDDEKADLKAADDLIEKLNKIKDTYENYVAQKLYQKASVPQGEIDALAETIAAHQNTQAYNDVNAEITKIKNAYNTAVAELKAALVKEAAYLLNDALADLDKNINEKITAATQASYASSQAGMAVADKATNIGKLPTELQINTIVNNWKGQGTTAQANYDALHKVVTDLQASLDAVKYDDASLTETFATERAAAQKAIDDINTKVENAKNSAAQNTLDVSSDKTDAEGKISTLAGKVTTANAEFNANKATTEAIAVVQKAYNDAKTAVDAKVSKDEKYKAADYYAAYLKTQQDAIDKLTADAVKAYKVDGTGTAQTYNAGLAALTTPITTAISDYQTNAIAAVDKYDALQDAINGTDEQTGYQDSLDIARAEFKDLAIYEAEGYDYKTKFDLIQKRINDIKKAITAAQGKVGAEHWTAMLNINADAAILTDIADLVAEKQTKQDQYDQNFLGSGLDDLDTRIAAFNMNPTEAEAKLGKDYQVFLNAEDAIAAKVTKIKKQKDDITPGAEGSAAAIQALGVKTTEIQAEQTALEEAAAYIAAKVTANGTAQTSLDGSITTLLGKITTFKNTYKIGQDASTLGNRGKASGAITTEINDVLTALTKLQGNNTAVDPTAVTNVDKTDKVSKDASAWGGSVPPYGDQTIVEKYESTTANIGNIMSQKVTGLDNGIYDVTLRASANFTPGRGFDGLSADANDVAYIYANDIKQFITAKVDGGTDGEYTISKVLVTDGTLDLGMAKVKPGTNWHTIQIKSLTYHENDLKATYNNAEKSGLNDQYNKLAAKMDSLNTVAPNIVKAVENNAKAYKAATDAYTAAQTEYDKLKNALLTDANGDLDKGKARQGDPANWWIYRNNLPVEGKPELKTYADDKAIVTKALNTMQDGIAEANAKEDMVAWNSENLEHYTKTIADSVVIILNRMQFESDNYFGYRHIRSNGKNDVGTKQKVNDTYFTNSFTAARKDLATDDVAGSGAADYYFGLVGNGADVTGSYEDELAAIRNRMYQSLYNRTATADQAGYITELKALRAKIDKVQTDAKANLKKYNEQKKAADDTQTLWNSTYTEIAATDHSSKVQDWLNELDAIQVTLTGAKEAVEANYEVGKSVAEAKDFAAIKASINDVKARQSESYSEFVAADNKAAHESFMGNDTKKGAIQKATEAYQTAVQERAKYSATNEDIKAAVETAAATLDAALYSCPTDIEALTKAENEAYTAVVSPEVFNVDPFNTQALTIEQDITDALNTFKAAVKAAIKDNVWQPKKTTYDSKVTDAKNAIAAYDVDAKKDAFKDVEDLIAAGEAALNAWTLAGVEAAIEGLEDIDNMLAADKDAAAEKDINKRIAAADTKYTTVKAYIEGKTIADDVNNVKATKLAEIEAKYDDKNDNTHTDVAYAKTLAKTFAKRDEAAAILDGFITIADNAKTAVDNAIADDVNNTKAYNEMVEAIQPVADKLAEAKAAAAPYKYATSFATDEATLDGIKTDASTSKANGDAVATKATVVADLATLSTAIETTLTTAFGTEKTGLSADITELKNQYNAYVAANGLGETATAYKKDIDDLEAAVAAIAIEDLDKPTDGIQYDEILAATAKLVKLQKDIADKQSKLLEANASEDSNANVLANFTGQLNGLAEKATLEGNDKWVGEQTVGGKKISEAIAAIQAQIADVKAAIEAEENISFYKDQYQAEIDAIKVDLAPVTAAITAKQAQFTANADAYTTLSAAITTLQGKVDAAKAKVAEYKYNGVEYNFISLFEVYNAQNKLTGGVQKDINDQKEWLANQNTAVALTANSNLGTLEAVVNTAVQNYLDGSAYEELDAQRQALSTSLTNAIDVKKKANTYSSRLWARLMDEKGEIGNEINDLYYEIWNSYQRLESTPDYNWVIVDNQTVAKDCTSDADYAAQMQTVAAIAQKIADLSAAVDNLGLLGDANEDGKVNVLDYQKVLNMILDPTLLPEDGSDLFINTDINHNEVVEVGDLTAIVNYILTHDWSGYAAARGYGMSDSNESLSMTQDTKRIAVSLANVSDYTAFQMDLVLPDGMKIVGTSLSNRAGESHKLYSRNQMDGSIRLLASSVTGETFSGNEGAVLYIDVETTGEYMGGKAELLNILFADTNAQTRSFTIGGDATGIDTVGTFEALKQKVYDLGGRVKDGLKKGINIIRRADGSTQKVVK